MLNKINRINGAIGFPAFAKYNPFTQTVYRDLACEIITKKHA